MAEEILKVFITMPHEKLKFSNTVNKSDKKRVEIGISVLEAESL